jgi:hypothetical protein
MMFVFYGLGGVVLIASVIDGNLNNAIGGAIWFIPGAVCSYASDRITKRGSYPSLVSTDGYPGSCVIACDQIATAYGQAQFVRIVNKYGFIPGGTPLFKPLESSISIRSGFLSVATAKVRARAQRVAEAVLDFYAL